MTIRTVKARNGYRRDYGKSSGNGKGKKPVLDAVTTEVIRAAAGEEAINVARIIAAAGNVSELKIVEKTKLDIQKVRNFLYKLHSSNIADYEKVKDGKKGVYVSYWTFNKDAAKELFYKLQQERLHRFKERLEAETSNLNGFFICPAACTRTDFSTAEQQRFRCEECGKLMMQDDNTRTIDVLREKIREMEAAVA